MSFNKKYIQTSDPYKKNVEENNDIRNIYYGEVISIDDPTDGGIIKVKILGLDNKITDTNDLPDCYPLLPKFFHVYPKIGEMVRIFIEDTNYPQRSRFWLGSIISQPQKIEFDSIYTALSTTNYGLTLPEAAPSTFPDADGVFPTKQDIAILGRVNTDIILRDNQLEFRAGKHENDDILKLNTTNPASVALTFETNENTNEFYSSTIVTSDKIALISHDGIPKFKAARINSDDRLNIFDQAHPIARGDILVNMLNIFRRAIIGHLHGYSGIEADKNSIINDLEQLNLEDILQRNIVIN